MVVLIHELQIHNAEELMTSDGLMFLISAVLLACRIVLFSMATGFWATSKSIQALTKSFEQMQNQGTWHTVGTLIDDNCGQNQGLGREDHSK